ncbi:MAG: hypothetical protein A3G49_02285 [Candidatus Sungbacteria bacterium RIFCSPLOWO2_12_FULL_41_11]|uniref:Uncharacterized protein n=1 Tax=Candidatus Sungbacteria bacterium RIFCSPLOWO2_12_FULL_41_11 TaxID=1802286 RepID=A0A1G2LNI4_9BACT|nr:MAG: hypothetical protein UV01_C0004G0048 [Parcubacteria group bacterium GW2011_GWA2_42_14]OGZ97218.1 MAG: hypothetical protein A3D41_00215 [Candidatus Sungbacteria bacterium RIFCSPHIGHO2_02_FULL_41_12b]OHA13170.1 MAG: hypothetical protein A3G49_02285 [Candidatus Sungbacteria bacterium RIFCSPLOWO2_12_FULL_41_11]
MSYKKIFQYLDREQKNNIFKLLKKHKKSLKKIFIVVFYSIGSIQNKYQERPGDKGRNGDYGRRWRQALDRLVEARQEELIKSSVLLVHIDPTKLDVIVAKKSMRILQPQLRSLQKQLKLDQLHKAFSPIKKKELEVLLMREKNILVVGWIHLAEMYVSGGSAQEVIVAELFGVPLYLNSSEDVVQNYKSRHVLDSIAASKKDVVKSRNIFYNAEDTLNKIIKDIPRIRRERSIPALGKLFVYAWNRKMTALK